MKINARKRLFHLIPTKKCLVGFALFLAVFVFNTAGYTRLLHREKPNEKKSGRIVKLEEVMRIHDDGEEIIFKNPRYFSQLDDGSLICFDYPALYRFDDKGKLLFKILNIGEGPGQYKYPDYYYIDGERLFFYSWIPPKLLEYDLNGNYLKEKRVPTSTFVYLGYIDGKIFGIRDEIRYSEFIHKEGIFETPYTLYRISPNFRKREKILDISVEHYIMKARWRRRTGYAFVPYKHYLFCLHTAEYQVDKIDLRSGRIEKIFKRPYDRIKSTKKGTVQDDPDPYNPPIPRNLLPPSADYKWDIYWIQVAKNTLWVFTSTMKDEMQLIDVFDMDGTYIDNFYLQFPENNEYHGNSNFLITDDGYIFKLEENIDSGLLSIAKYKIIDN